MSDPLAIAALTVIYRDELGRDPDPGGLVTWLGKIQVEGWTYAQVRQAVHDSPEAVAYRARPTVPAIRIEGPNFLDQQTGQRVCLSGIDAFCEFDSFLKGVDLAPFFAEGRRYDFTVRRVFLQGSAAQNGVLDLRPARVPNYYPRLRDYAHRVNDEGSLLLATVYADEQDVQSGLIHYQRTVEALRDTGTILSPFNEVSKNKSAAFGAADIPDPGAPFIWSRGSDISDAPPPGVGNVAEFHLRRDWPKCLDDTIASATFLNLGIPLLMTEGPPMGEAQPAFGDHLVDAPFDRPDTAWQTAHSLATLWALAVFHNRQSQSGRLMSIGTCLCAEGWQDGIRL